MIVLNPFSFPTLSSAACNLRVWGLVEKEAINIAILLHEILATL